MKIRRALLSVSDKTGIVELAKQLALNGVEIVATGKTAEVISKAGVAYTPVEKISKNPEAFGGRMKTLSFSIFSGILYRRQLPEDEATISELGVLPIDCVVVNFYPFEKNPVIEEIDIGGPALVRAAAKNSPDVLVLVDPTQYFDVIEELKKTSGEVSHETCDRASKQAWKRVLEYDRAIAEKMAPANSKSFQLRYGENPHQRAELQLQENGVSPLTPDVKVTTELSYNNWLDLSSAYQLLSELKEVMPEGVGAVVVKHNNPCGVAWVNHSVNDGEVSLAEREKNLMSALELAWEGDSISAFGGVVIVSERLSKSCAEWLSRRFIEVLAAPGLDRLDQALDQLLREKRKSLKRVIVNEFGVYPTRMVASIPGGDLIQSIDKSIEFQGETEPRQVQKSEFGALDRFGITVCKWIKSNAVALVRAVTAEKLAAFQCVGVGQGQPNRIEALEWLAIPRARRALSESQFPGSVSDCIFVSDAFFPFRDCVDSAAKAGIKRIIQPGGSMRDQESLDAAKSHGIEMVMTGVRHFRH